MSLALCVPLYAGAMAKHHTEERLSLYTSTELLARIDVWRRTQADLPARADAIRRLVDMALAVPVAPASRVETRLQCDTRHNVII